MEIEQNIWGFTPEGGAVVVYTLRNAAGAEVKLSNAGAALISATVPGRDGSMADVALGYRNFADYMAETASMGKCVGRWAGLVPGGLFTLDGQTFRLPCNHSEGQLDGGPGGFGSRLWESFAEGDRVVFTLLSPDGEQGWPGEVETEIVYGWNEQNELSVSIYTRSDAPTAVNAAFHPWLNLAGEESGSVSGQQVRLPGKKYATLDESGVMAGNGVCLNTDGRPEGSPAAELRDPGSGRTLAIFTDAPSLKIYAGNRLQGTPLSKSGNHYDTHGGFAVVCGAEPLPAAGETQGTVADLSPVALRPGEVRCVNTIFRFSVD